MSEELTRPIIGIENRTPLEVFDIMCDRIRALTRPDEAISNQEVEPVSFAWTAANGRPYPPYVNLTGNRIRVRGEPSHGEVMPFTTGWIEGPYVSVELPDETIEGLRQALSKRTRDEHEEMHNALADLVAWFITVEAEPKALAEAKRVLRKVAGVGA